jgi:hypothetical protein
MDELVSAVTRGSNSFGKNEEDGKRVKRRRMMRKCHLDGVRVREEIREDRRPAAFMLFDHFTGTEWRNNTVSRA